MGEITNEYTGELFQAFGIDVSNNSTKLGLGSFRNNAEGVDPNVMIDYPLLIDGNSAFGTSTADRDRYYVLNHEGIITHILIGNRGSYIGDEPMQELEDSIAAAIANIPPAGPADLTINFSDLNGPHGGQMLALRVVDVSTGMSVADTSIEAIPMTGFSFTFTGVLEAGKDYNVDFYADANENGTYDAPPADHAWRESLTAVSGNQTVDFSHNASFTDIEFPTSIKEKQHFSKGIGLEINQGVMLVTLFKDIKVGSKIFAKGYNLKGKIVWSSEKILHQKSVKFEAPPITANLIVLEIEGNKFFRVLPHRVE